MNAKKHRIALFYPAVLLLLLSGLLLLWELLSRGGTIDPLFFSRPTLVWLEFLSLLQSGTLLRHFSVTAHEAALGLFYGSIFGSLIGILMGASKRSAPLVMPVMVGLSSIPKLALAPLFILWFGIGLTSKVLMAGLMVFFIFAFNLYAGYRSVDAALVHTLRLLGATKLQIVRHVIWPSCLPWFLASLRSGLGLALSGAVVGELIGASRGLGWLINDAAGRYDLTRVLSCIFVIIVLMMCLDFLVRSLERLLLKWRPET